MADGCCDILARMIRKVKAASEEALVWMIKEELVAPPRPPRCSLPLFAILMSYTGVAE